MYRFTSHFITLNCLIILSSCEFSASEYQIPLDKPSTVTFTITPDDQHYGCPDNCLSMRNWVAENDTEVAIYELGLFDIADEPLLTLNDDGNEGDGQANDGILSGNYTFNESTPGILTFVATYQTKHLLSTAPIKLVVGDRDTIGTQLVIGRQLYIIHCAFCHAYYLAEDTTEALNYVLEHSIPASDDSAIVKGELDTHISLILNGVPDTLMNGYSDLSNEALSAIITYERFSLGLNYGDMVANEDVNALRSD